jgi:hypothetical protein
MSLALATALSGCSVMRLTYNNADWLLLKEMNAYLELTRAQEAAAFERLGLRLEEHRRDELPEYLVYLRRVRSAAEDGLSEGETEWTVERGYQLARIAVARTIPAISSSLVGLSNEQIHGLEDHLAERNRKFRHEYLPKSEKKRAARRARRTIKRIEHWTGALSEEQRHLAARLRNAFPRSAEAWLAYNMQNQQRLLSLLRARADGPTLEAFLNGWWVHLEGRPAALKRKNDEALAAMKQLIRKIGDTLDDSQRRFLLWRLDGDIDQIEKLVDHR